MTAIKPGIYETPNGSFRVVARVGDRATGPKPKEKRYPKGTPVRKMLAWQEDQRAELRRTKLRPVRGTLAQDVETYLALVKPRLISFKGREYDTRRWLER